MTAVTTERCVLCGGPEPFGLSVCPGCGGAAHAVGDTLVFVRPAEAREDREFLDAALADLLRGRAHPGEYDMIARGHQALIRLPNAAADTALKQLALRGIPAQVRPARNWTSVPGVFYLLVGAVWVVGMLAGWLVLPAMRWSSPLVALLLLIGAQIKLRRPIISTPARRPVFPAELERQIGDTFSQLPDGEARNLLANLVRAAERVRRALDHQVGPSKPEEIDELVGLACRSALDLFDIGLVASTHGARPSLQRARQLKDGINRKLVQATEVLERLRVEAAYMDPDRERLAELLQELNNDVGAYAEVRREIRTDRTD